MIVASKYKTNNFLDLHNPIIIQNYYCITSIRHQGDYQVLVAHPVHVGVTTTISVPLIIGLSLTTAASNTSTTVYASTSNRSPVGSTSVILWTKKLTMGTPVTEILAPMIGWITTNASSKLLPLPLRCFNSSFTALLDCGASHDFISEDLVNQIGIKTPTKVEPMPIHLADQSIMTSDYSVSLPIRFTLYHVCNIVFHIVPTLTHGMLLGMEWFSLFSLVVNWTS